MPDTPPLPELPSITNVEDNIVFMLHPREVARKKALFSGSGTDKLQIFSDFDHVFTQHAVDGKRCPDTMAMLETSGVLSREVLEAMNMAIADIPQVSCDMQCHRHKEIALAHPFPLSHRRTPNP